MQKSLKQYCPLIFGGLIFTAVLTLLLCLPLSVYAATGSLGSETPVVYCTYKDTDGKEVDGNKLGAGTYEVTFNVKDMSSASVLQITASYPESVTVDSSAVNQLSDADTNFSSMGYLASDGNIVFGYVSNAEDTSALASEGTALFSVDMTFSEACDTDGDGFIDPDVDGLITAASNPNLTFALADYGDGYDDEYAIDISTDTSYNGERYQMLFDASPSSGHTVSGSIVVMSDTTGATNGVSAYGEYTVDVYSDSDRSDLVTSATTDNEVGNNKFTTEALSPGTYYATITSQYAIPRNVTIVVEDNDIDAGQIPMIPCEFDGNGGITADDAKFVYRAASTKEGIEYCDFDGNGGVTADDAKLVFKFATSTDYKDLVIRYN